MFKFWIGKADFLIGWVSIDLFERCRKMLK